MRVLVACEFSGVVREAFRRRGHNAWSCDILPSEKPSRFHIQSTIQSVLSCERHPDYDARSGCWRSRCLDGDLEGRPLVWDLMIAHPPCTHLAVSGARWFKDKQAEQAKALDFVRLLMGAAIPHIAIENPISIISSHIRKPDQIVQPWMFGHGETKATCLWLKQLPRLRPTNVVDGRVPRVHHEPPGPDRWKRRSITYAGIASAMADQWGSF